MTAVRPLPAWVPPCWLAGTLAALTAVNPNWLVPITPHWGWVDQWLYLANTLFPDYLVRTAPSNYYSTRISWTAPERLLHGVLPDPAAFTMFHLAAWLAFTAIVYLSVRRLFAPRAALFTAVLFGLFTHVVWLEASPMPHAGAFTYLLAALGVVARQRQGDSTAAWRSAVFGACVVLAAIAHILIATLVPLTLVWYVLNRPRREPRPRVRDLAALLGGAAAAAVAAGIYFQSIGADFWYAWRVNWTSANELGSSGYAANLHTPLAWPFPEQLLWPSAIALLSAAAVLRTSLTRRWLRLVHPRGDLALVLYLAAWTIYVAWQFAGGLTVQIAEYFSQIFPFMVLALGRLLWPLLRRAPLGQYLGMLLAATVVLLIPLHHAFPLRPEAHLTPLQRAPVLWGCGLAAVAGALLMSRRRVLAWIPWLIVLFSISNVMWRNDMMFPHALTRDSFLAALAGARDLEPAFRRSLPGDTALWYSRGDAAAAVFGGLHYMFYSTPPIGCDAPALGTGCGAQTLSAGLPQHVILLSSQADTDAEIAALSAAGHHVREQQRRRVVQGLVHFWIHDLVDLSASARLPTRSSPASTDGPDRTIVAWRDLAKVLQQIGYSGSPTPLLAGSDRLVFTPLTERDHLATPFVALTPDMRPQSLELVLTNGFLSNANCTATLQDNRYRTLGRVDCSRFLPRSATSVPLAGGVTGVRVVFEGVDLQPQRLPKAIALLRHDR